MANLDASCTHPGRWPIARGITHGTAGARDHRERQIAEVLGRYGLSHLVEVLGLGRLVSAADGLMRREVHESHTEPENLRLALEELGPTFIKLGQLLSTRADLLSPDYRTELAKLQDAAPASAADAIRGTVESELPGGVAGAFAEFEEEPLAAGSVGEAHAALLHDGTRVVVKVRRPG